MSSERVILEYRDNEVLVKPAGFLRGSLFDSYVQACHRGRARYDGRRRAQVADLEGTPVIIDALTIAGFIPQITPDLAASLQARAAAMLADATGADTRADATDAELRARGLFLFPYQRVGIRWLAARMAALLAWEMGLGKTLAALLAAPEGAPINVICPAIAKGVWERECAKWRPDLTPVRCQGRKGFRWAEPGELVIANYEILPSDDPGAPGLNAVLVADEAHAFKSSSAQRTRRFRTLATRVMSAAVRGRCWLLTGTPLLNNPKETFDVLKAADLHLKAFGSWSNFINVCGGTEKYYGGYDWGTPKPEAAECLKRVSLYTKRIEVLPDLPTATQQTVTVSDLSAECRKVCDAALAALAEKGIDLDAKAAQADAHKAMLPSFAEMSAAREALATAKVGAAEELIAQYAEINEPVVVFSAHRAPIEALGNKPGWGLIIGGMKDTDRDAVVTAFQAGDLQGIACTIGAGGVGITLTRSAHMVFIDYPWTPALLRQAIDRCVRVGQTRGVLVTSLIAEHALDIRVCELIQKKAGLFDAVVGASARDATHETDDTIDALQRAAGTDVAARGGMTPGVQRHAPMTPIEQWVFAGLTILAADDADRAAELNGVGFNKLDTTFGHRMADRAALHGGLSEGEYRASAKLLSKYWRQTGHPPEESA